MSLQRLISAQFFWAKGRFSSCLILLLPAGDLQFLDQTEMLSKPASSYQKGVLRVLDEYFAIAHNRSLLH